MVSLCHRLIYLLLAEETTEEIQVEELTQMMAIANEEQRVVIDEILNLPHNIQSPTIYKYLQGIFHRWARRYWKNVCVSMFNPELH